MEQEKQTLEINKIYNMDCLEGMKLIPDKSIDCIICDLPYGTISQSWDEIIPLNDFVKIKNKTYNENDYMLYAFKNNIPYKEAILFFKNNKQLGLWSHYNRIIKDNGAIVLFCTQPFTTILLNSNKKNYKHCWVWDKKNGANFMNCKFQPYKVNEDILVFSSNGKKVNYYPQMVKGKMRKKGGYQKEVSNSLYGENRQLAKEPEENDLYYPKSIIEMSNANKKNKIHPTEKPVELVEYLIKTYSQEGQLILDNCMGSGSTAIAAINTNRNYIGFELEKKYYDLAVERINNHNKEEEK